MDMDTANETGGLEAASKLVPRILAHLEAKYHRLFQLVRLTRGDYLAFTWKATVRFLGETETLGTASVYAADHSMGLVDNAFGLMVLEEYEALARLALEGLFVEAKVFCAGFLNEAFHPALGAGSGMEDARRLGETPEGILYVYAQADARSVAACGQSVSQAMRKARLSALVKVIGLVPGRLAAVNRENFQFVLPFYQDGERQVCTGILDFHTTGKPAASAP